MPLILCIFFLVAGIKITSFIENSSHSKDVFRVKFRNLRVLRSRVLPPPLLEILVRYPHFIINFTQTLTVIGMLFINFLYEEQFQKHQGGIIVPLKSSICHCFNRKLYTLTSLGERSEEQFKFQDFSKSCS